MLISFSRIAGTLLIACALSFPPRFTLADVIEAPTLDELKRATLTGFEVRRKPVTLAAGKWEGKAYVEGGSARPSIELLPDLHLAADLDDDHSEEAIVLVAERFGGSGEWLHLVVMGRDQGRPRQRANVVLGDRVQVREAQVDHNRIVVDFVRSGPNDPACCPSELVTKTWSFSRDGLTEVPVKEEPRRLTIASWAGPNWVLREWDRDQAAPERPAITMELHGERISGSGGCNSYFSLARDGAQPGQIKMGNSGTTRKACAPAIDALESRFLHQLGAVKSFRFLATKLVLEFELDGKPGTMIFERARPEPEDEA